MTDNNIHLVSKPRDSVEIWLTNGQIATCPRGTMIGKVLESLPEWKNQALMGAIVNFELRELTFQVDMDSKVKPITMEDADGARIYRRSITFLLEAAFNDLFPNARLTVDHSVSSGGFFCQISGRPPLTNEEVKQLQIAMEELVIADLEFERKQVPIQEAIEYFENNGDVDKVHLLKYRTKEFLVLYTLGKHRDYHHGYMVPSTGYLKWINLSPLGEGFVLQYPRRQTPDRILPMPSYPMLLKTFREYGDWLSRLGIESVGALNDSIQDGKAQEVILVSEALHELQIAEIARDIVRKSDRLKIVLIAGPSSSGKTTFSRRLAVQLLAQGISPYALELDNYFVDRDATPLNADGDRDFEALSAMDIQRLGMDLQKAIDGVEVQLPHYNFKAGISEPGECIKLAKDQILILEGIHGLNPNLIPNIESDRAYKVYVSCLTQLNLDRHNRISTTDTREIRRIVRDARERGYSAIQTISRWDSVRKGEKLHIFPFQENADAMFNSALVYELSTLKPLVEPLLRQVPFGADEYIESKRLLAFLEWFLPIDQHMVPDNSILREFLGDSILQEFTLWKASD